MQVEGSTGEDSEKDETRTKAPKVLFWCKHKQNLFGENQPLYRFGL